MNSHIATVICNLDLAFRPVKVGGCLIDSYGTRRTARGEGFHAQHKRREDPDSPSYGGADAGCQDATKLLGKQSRCLNCEIEKISGIPFCWMTHAEGISWWAKYKGGNP